MKIISLLLLLLLLSFSVTSQSSDDLPGCKYFHFGTTIPSKAYFGRSTAYWENSKRRGIVLEGGRLFMLNGIKLSPGLRLGIDYTYVGLQYHQFETGPSIYDKKEGIVALFSKVGPSISYSPVDHLTFDFYIKANVPWLALSYATENNFDSNSTEMYGGYLGYGYATGINIRYRVLLLNFEFNKASMKMESADYAGVFLGNDSEPGSDRTPMSALQITFGINI